jgi:hypothetical protein
MYVLYGAILASSWFIVLNVVSSAIVWLAIDRVCAITAGWNAANRARTLLMCRLLPTVVSIGFVAVVFVPSFGRFEPRHFDEGFGLVTTSLAIVGYGLLGFAAYRSCQALRESQRRVATWLRGATTIDLGMENVRTVCVDATHPVMTLVGLVRPTLLVTKPLVSLLTEEEMAAAIDHERGHRRSWDNLKRLAIRSCADTLSLFPASQSLEQAWSRSAEQAADRVAARDAASGLALASALLKVARASLPGIPSSSVPGLAHSLGTLAPDLTSPLVGGGGVALQARVESLLEGPEIEKPRSTSLSRLAAAIAGIVVVAGAALLAFHGYAPMLESVHTATEVAVHHLP